MSLDRISRIILASLCAIILVILPACSLTTRMTTVLAGLKETPTPEVASLGIPGNQVLQFYLDKGYLLDKNQGVVGQNRMVVTSPNGDVILNISAFQGEVINATIWIPLSPKNFLVEANRQDLVDFLDLLLPNWTGRKAWLNQNLQQASTSISNGNGQYYIIDNAPNAEVELTASTSTNQVVLLVLAVQQPGN